MEILMDEFPQQVQINAKSYNDADYILITPHLPNGIKSNQKHSILCETDLYPMNFARYWWFFHTKEHVKYYLIHGQLARYYSCLYNNQNNQSQFQKTHKTLKSLQEEYIDKWIGLLNSDKDKSWEQIEEGQLVKSAEFQMKQIISKSYDKNESNYRFGQLEDVWFTNSMINQLYFEHTPYQMRKIIETYVKISGLCFCPNYRQSKDIINQMLQNGISLQSSPVFDVKTSHEIICLLCSEVTWESFYVHQCKESYNQQSIQGNLQLWNL